MMPDLGKYAFEVLMSYAVSLGLLVVFIAVSLRRAAQVRRALQKVEERKNG
ncbi:heme exporter protein CcmD [Sagittula sp. SSi028]|uniref:heme exporter protein CcmD n=1 Tax=Sagittula sp. SSi028 TaxID=3400636 RepID=UPI003AF5D49E